jgi:hypothetical protein
MPGLGAGQSGIRQFWRVMIVTSGDLRISFLLPNRVK